MNINKRSGTFPGLGSKCSMVGKSGLFWLGFAAFGWLVFYQTAMEKSKGGDYNNVATKLAEAGYAETGALSRSLFAGTPFRTFSGRVLFQKDGWEKRIARRSLDWDTIVKKYYKKNQNIAPEITKKCSRWAVVTTIFEPNEAISGVASLDGWCMVIVGDNKTPNDYLERGKELADNDSVFFFSVQEQRQWLKLPGELGAFARATPFNHFARKNLGFLYAIIRGAQFIYDFDDDNFINKDSNGKLLPLISNEIQVENVRFLSLETKVLNHHPIMGATVPGSWPRGFPLESIQDTKTHGTVISSGNAVPMEKVGVLQFCADNNPDIDAVHRLVLPLPMNYAPESKSSPILVPSSALVPYNAQATIHTYRALFAVLLPITVKGRVTDIWRSYFSECLFRTLGLGVIFLPPRITQYRNAHSYIADMKAEGDLYFKSERLSEFLSKWDNKSTAIPARMEALWIDLYERGYIEEDDVKLMQLWLGALVQIGYQFK